MFKIFKTAYIYFHRYIERNPFECNCDLEPFIVFVRTKGLKLNFYSETPKCNSPRHLIGVQIIDVLFQSMSCSTTYETTIPIRTTTVYESTKRKLYSTTMENDQHTSGISFAMSNYSKHILNS